MTEKHRIAHCVCGGLRVECSGEPELVSACHCTDCQRRTGSALGVAAFFPATQVRVEGDSARFSRTSDEGFRFDFYFCPRCGGTVYWETERKPGIRAVAVGTFADPNFNAPTRSAFAEHQQPWLSLNL